MSEQRVVKLFKNGRNQAIRIPREFELPGDEAILRKDGNRLINLAKLKIDFSYFCLHDSLVGLKG